LTVELMERLLANCRASKLKEQDHRPVVKFFTPDARAVWLFSELDEDGDTPVRPLRPRHAVTRLREPEIYRGDPNRSSATSGSRPPRPTPGTPRKPGKTATARRELEMNVNTEA
jgi:hypothetical protein